MPSRNASVCPGHRHLDAIPAGHAAVVAHVAGQPPSEIAVSVVTVEEQLSGWYAQLRKAGDPEKLAWAYRRLAANVRFLRNLQILDYDEEAIARYEAFRRSRLRVRKMDLQIAAAALRHGANVVTRNAHDFKKVPGLRIEDWSK